MDRTLTDIEAIKRKLNRMSATGELSPARASLAVGGWDRGTDWISLNKAALLTGRNRSNLYAMLTRNNQIEIPVISDGRWLIIHREALCEWFQIKHCILESEL